MTKKEYYGKIEMLQVTPQICDVFLKSREQFMEPVLKHYGVNLSDLRIELRKEYCISQFTVREMDLALHFLIENCRDRQDECAETLHEEVTKCILYSGIYFTNILPGIESGEGVADVITPEKAVEIKSGFDNVGSEPAKVVTPSGNVDQGISASNTDTKANEANNVETAATPEFSF